MFRLTKITLSLVSLGSSASSLPVYDSLSALGLENGNVELYQADITEDWKFHSRIQVHNAEVLCLSWKQNFLATGGRDRFVHVIEIDPTSQHSPTKTSVPLDIHTSIVTAVHWMKGNKHLK